jgi:CRISPR/Cas system-associated exonuclease Cas4 (RecB family)
VLYKLHLRAIDYPKPYNFSHLHNVEIMITENMKTYLEKIIAATANIIESEEEPDARIPASRCSGGCGYLWICGGIWNRK